MQTAPQYCSGARGNPFWIFKTWATWKIQGLPVKEKTMPTMAILWVLNFLISKGIQN